MKRYFLLSIFLALLGLSACQDKDKRTGGKTGGEETPPKTESGFTVSKRGKCLIRGHFTLGIKGTGVDREMLVADLQPEIFIESNGILSGHIKDLTVSPYGGTLTLTWYRGEDGQTVKETKTQAFDDSAALHAWLLKEAAPVFETDKLGLDAQHTRVTERIRMTAQWEPKDPGESCAPIHEETSVTWVYATAQHNLNWGVVDGHVVGGGGISVEAGEGVVADTVSHGTTTYRAIHTVVKFGVTSPFACCKTPDTDHAIIQFVQHSYRLGTKPAATDPLNLDVLDGQSQLASGGSAYDPTFTNFPNPAGAATAGSNGLVGVSPSGTGVVIKREDYPGLPDDLYQRFLSDGGWFQWDFTTFLVCQAKPSTAAEFAAHGKVKAMAHFKIRMTFTQGAPAPKIEAGLVEASKTFDPCKDLSSFLKGEYKRAYEHPTSHGVSIPK